MKNMKKIYVAGKLNDDDAVKYLNNCNLMIRHADKLRKAGYAVFIPCIDFIMGMSTGTWTYDDFFDNSQPWLASSDAVYVCPKWETSKGTQREIDLAESLNIPVVYNFEDLEKLFKDK